MVNHASTEGDAATYERCVPEYRSLLRLEWHRDNGVLEWLCPSLVRLQAASVNGCQQKEAAKYE